VSVEEIRSLIDRSRRSLRSAANVLDDGDHDFAMSRAYYAMFYAAAAALLARGIRRSKHSGVIAAFGEHVVKPGPFTPTQQRNLQAAFRDRGEGDYTGAFPIRDAVERRIVEAREFVLAVEQFLRTEGIALD
jgi:uncharacterized protein (UPF0332 family)